MSDPVTVIIGRYSNVLAAAARNPGAVIVCCNTGWMARDGAAVCIKRRAARLALLIFLARQGHVIDGQEIMDLVFEDDANGGPESRFCSFMGVEVANAAAALGFALKTHGYRGHSLIPLRSVEDVA